MNRLLLAWLFSFLSLVTVRALAQESPPNTLTDDEKKAGFKLLFDGKTTDGWRGYKMKQMPPGWKVIDGILTRVAAGAGGKGAGGGDDIVTMTREDRRLGPRRVVLGKRADPREQRAPRRIIEVLRRDRRGPREQVRDQLAAFHRGIGQGPLDDAHALVDERALHVRTKDVGTG